VLARDASYGDLRTPLHKAVAGGLPIAVQLLVRASRRRETEGAWVRRWDAVAGGAGADWATCLRLLERATADVALDGAASTAASSTRVWGGVSSFRAAN
jgi:hypothetical protein